MRDELIKRLEEAWANHKKVGACVTIEDGKNGEECLFQSTVVIDDIEEKEFGRYIYCEPDFKFVFRNSVEVIYNKEDDEYIIKYSSIKIYITFI